MHGVKYRCHTNLPSTRAQAQLEPNVKRFPQDRAASWDHCRSGSHSFIASRVKGPDPQLKMQFLQIAYRFHTIAKLKNSKCNHHEEGLSILTNASQKLLPVSPDWL